VADWRQIQARIRKARNSPDPVGQLAEIYEHTRDAMVAFELARFQEKAGQNAEAARWYTAAAERFRRAQWKTKAQEALARLGAVPVAGTEPAPAGGEVSEPAPESGDTEPVETPVSLNVFGRPEEPPAQAHPVQPAPEGEQRRGGRRGRRGGRGRSRGRIGAAPVALPPRSSAAPAVRHEERREPEPAPSSFEATVGPAAFQARARAAEPALASRLASLESQLRRLVASPLYRLDEADQAPAGPGVFILSDSDLSTHYYIEACRTLRIGIGKMLRGERGSSGGSLKAEFAEHLGISESRVAKYIKDHCVVRWQQLDEGAGPLAHFAIAVLRPVLND
jgi:hypothetical protein